MFLGVLAPKNKVGLENAQNRLVEQLNLAFINSESSISLRHNRVNLTVGAKDRARAARIVRALNLPKRTIRIAATSGKTVIPTASISANQRINDGQPESPSNPDSPLMWQVAHVRLVSPSGTRSQHGQEQQPPDIARITV